MKAAVLHTFGAPPRFAYFPDPIPHDEEVLISVRAASLKNIDKMMVSGSHYDRPQHLPAVCGVDGVGTLDDGTRVYCGGCRFPYGMMAERAVVSQSWYMPLPDGLDDLTAAALPNPALSSWLPLVWRAQLKPGETVLILGATGVAGKLAIQIAKHLGAGRVVAAGRNAEVLATLPALGADATITLNMPDVELVTAFQREAHQQPFDIVLDFTWGHPTEVLVTALTGHDVKATPTRTRLIQIGEMAGAHITLPAAALRSSGLELYGSGGGSIPHTAIFEAFPQILALAACGILRIDVEPVPLADVEQAWLRQPMNGHRVVLIP